MAGGQKLVIGGKGIDGTGTHQVIEGSGGIVGRIGGSFVPPGKFAGGVEQDGLEGAVGDRAFDSGGQIGNRTGLLDEHADNAGDNGGGEAAGIASQAVAVE